MKPSLKGRTPGMDDRLSPLHSLPEKGNIFSYFEALTALAHERNWSRLRAGGYRDISPSHFAVFRFLGRKPEGSRLSEIADAAGITKQSMGYLVDQLEAAGYLQRRPHPTDRRAQCITLTDRGREVVELTRLGMEEDEEELAGRLGPRRWESFRKALVDASPPAFLEPSAPSIRLIVVPSRPAPTLEGRRP